MTEKFDFMLNAGVDTSAIVDEIKSAIKDAKAEVKKEKLTISNVKIDDSGILASFIKELQTLAKNNAINLDIDFTNFNQYQTELNNLKKDIESLDKTNIKNVISSELNKEIKVTKKDIQSLADVIDDLYTNKISSTARNRESKSIFGEQYTQNKYFLDKFKEDITTFQNLTKDKQLIDLDAKELSEAYKLLTEISKINTKLGAQNRRYTLSDGSKMFDLSTNGLDIKKLTTAIEQRMEMLRRGLTDQLTDIQGKQSAAIFTPILEAITKVGTTAQTVSNSNQNVELIDVENVQSSSKEIDALRSKLLELEEKKKHLQDKAVFAKDTEHPEDEAEAINIIEREIANIDAEISRVNKTIQAYQKLNLDGELGSSVLSVKELNENLEKESESLKQVQVELKKYGAVFDNLTFEDVIQKMQALNAQFEQLKSEGKNKAGNAEFAALKKEIGSLYKYAVSQKYDLSSLGSFKSVAEMSAQGIKIDNKTVAHLQNQEKWHQKIIKRIQEEIRLKQESQNDNTVSQNNAQFTSGDSIGSTTLAENISLDEQSLNNFQVKVNDIKRALIEVSEAINDFVLTEQKIGQDLSGFDNLISKSDILKKTLDETKYVLDSYNGDSFEQIRLTISNTESALKAFVDEYQNGLQAILEQTKNIENISKNNTFSTSPFAKNFEEEKNVVGTIVDQEKTKLSELTDAILNIGVAVDIKTEAFRNEGQIVNEVVAKEIIKLNELDSILKGIVNRINDISGFEIKINQLPAEEEKIPEKAPKKKNKKAEAIKETANAYKQATEDLKEYYNLYNKYLKGQLGSGKNGLAQKQRFEELSKEIQEATQEQGKFANATGEAAQEQIKFNQRLDEYKELFKESFVNRTTALLENSINKTGKVPMYDTKVEEIHKKITDLDKILPIDFTDQNSISKLQQAENEIKEMISDLDGDDLKAALAGEIDQLVNKAAKLSRNTAMDGKHKARLRAIIEEINNAKNSVDGFNKIKFNELRKQLSTLETDIINTGQTGLSLGDKIQKKFKDVAAYFATYVSIQDVIQVIKNGLGTINEYDKALTEMNKVSDETLQTLKEFQKESFKLADAVGTTAKQLDQSTADWMRLGESLEEAKQSAQDANILFNVSEFETIDEATESLVSMSQAFKELSKGEIIDVVNNLGNNFAISTDGLASALQNSASALQTAKNDFFESAALTTAANTVVQDPNKVGAGKLMPEHIVICEYFIY